METFEQISERTGYPLPLTIACAGRAIDAMIASANKLGIGFCTTSLEDGTTHEDFTSKVFGNDSVHVIVERWEVEWIERYCEANQIGLKGRPWIFVSYADKIIPLGKAWPEREREEWWDHFLVEKVFDPE